MKSFDEYNAREQQLVQFNKWADHEGLSLRMSGEFDHSNKDTHMAYLGYVEGQQSKQAEVDDLKRELLNRTNEAYADGQRSMRKMIKSNEDELRERIDEISNHVEINYDENRDDDSHSYWSGYNQALRELFEILKGDQS